jgi:hypothetical protein
MNERRRLEIESRAIIAKTRQTAEELAKCVARSRRLVAESTLLLKQSKVAAACPHIRRLDHMLFGATGDFNPRTRLVDGR